MRFAFVLAAMALACSAAAAGCASEGDELASTSGGAGGDSLEKPSISLDTNKTIDLKPGATVAISATVHPGGRQSVGFALLGDSADAALDATIVRTNEAGVATAHLQAPSVATTFLLRVTLIGDTDVTDTVPIAVSSKGFATIEAVPHYEGDRDVTSWTATVLARTSCAALAPTLPDLPPGGLEVTGKPNATLVIHDVPVGPPIAVVVRAGHFAFGCVDGPALVPNTSTKLGVTVLDTPLDLAATRLDFALDFTPDPTDFGMLVSDGIELVETTIFSQSQDADFLLDAMEHLAPSGFSQARSDDQWDATTTQHLQALGVDFRSEIEGWTSAGIGIQPPTLSVRLTGSDLLAQSLEARLSVLWLGSFSPGQAGLTKTIGDASWLAQADDVVHLDALVPWRPSALVASAALVGAQIAYPGVATVGDALALESACEDLGVELGGYASCDASCLGTICTTALETAWAPAAAISMPGDGSLSITVVGHADVDDAAAPESVDGQWLGALSAGTVVANVMGAATATKTGSHPPP